jgi:hypothetical protein
MTNLFSPKLAQSPELEAFFLSLEEESAGLTNDQAFVGTFRKLWGEGYFSHYDLRFVGLLRGTDDRPGGSV